jgi:hypothetical protein
MWSELREASKREQAAGKVTGSVTLAGPSAIDKSKWRLSGRPGYAGREESHREHEERCDNSCQK